MAYLLCKSVIDHNELKLDELIYFASEALSNMTGGEAKLTPSILYPELYKKIIPPKEEASVTYKDIYGVMTTPKRLDESGTAVELTADLLKDAGQKGKAYREVDKENHIYYPISYAPLDCYTEPGQHNPPRIQEVEAYIEEMIRVWNKLKKAGMQ